MRSRSLPITLAVLVALLGACGGGAAGEDAGDFIEVPGLGPTRVDVPRPATTGREACALALPADGSLEDRLTGLREAGLFADRADPVADLADEIERSIAEMWGPIDQDDPLFELFVAEQDPSRVWWRDLEADVGAGSEV